MPTTTTNSARPQLPARARWGQRAAIFAEHRPRVLGNIGAGRGRSATARHPHHLRFDRLRNLGLHATAGAAVPTSSRACVENIAVVRTRRPSGLSQEVLVRVRSGVWWGGRARRAGCDAQDLDVVGGSMRVLIPLAPVLLLTGCAPKVESPPGSWSGNVTHVTLRRWDAFAGRLLDAERMEAVRQTARTGTWQGSGAVALKLIDIATDPPTPKSEIIDADGTVWIVHRMERTTSSYTVCDVTKRELGWPWSRPSTTSAPSVAPR